MIKFLRTLLLLMICFYCFNASGQRIQRLYLSVQQSDSIIKPKQFNKYIDYKTDFFLEKDRQKEIGKVVRQMNSAGFLTAEVDSIVKIDSLHTTAYVKTGEQYRWGIIKPGNVEEGMLSKSGFREKIYNNRPFNHKSLRRLQERLLKYAENHGYPFATIRLDSVRVDGNTITASLNLQKNDLFTIDSLIVKGEAKIKPVYLYSYLGIEPGDLYNEAIIRKIDTRLKELAFVRQKQSPQVRFTKKKASIFLFLDDKNASQFNGILGVLPDNQTGNVLITGDLKLKLQNSFGRGEIIDINWRKLQSQTQDLKANFVYPFLFSTPFGIDLKLELYKRDTTFLNLNRILGVQYLLSGGNYLKAFVDSRTSNLLSTEGLENITTLPDYADISVLLYGLEFNYEKLDYRFNPRRGISLNINASAGNKKIKRNARINPEVYEGLDLKSLQVNGLAQVDYFVPIGRRSTIKPGVKAGYIWNENLFQNELFRIGGLRTLRGFDEESIFASLYSIANVEYRYLLEQNSYLLTFFDYAYYENESQNNSVSDRPYGFGAGISFETAIGIFSLNYALGKQFDNPIEFRSAKIHFGVVNRF